MQKMSLVLAVGFMVGLLSLEAAAPCVALTPAKIADLQAAFEREATVLREANRRTWLRTSVVAYLTRCDAVTPEEQAAWDRYDWERARNILYLSDVAGCEDLATAFAIYSNAYSQRDRCQDALKKVLLALYAEKKQKIMAMTVEELLEEPA